MLDRVLKWMRHLLEELCIDVKLPMSMHCDDKTAIHIASNLVFHERVKHIATPFVSMGAQLVG